MIKSLIIRVGKIFIAAVLCWAILFGLMQLRPRVLDGKILAITSPACERYSRLGIPIGSKSGQVYQNVVLLWTHKGIQ